MPGQRRPTNSKMRDLACEAVWGKGRGLEAVAGTGTFAAAFIRAELIPLGRSPRKLMIDDTRGDIERISSEITSESLRIRVLSLLCSARPE